MVANVVRRVAVVAVSALSFVGFLTLVGYLHEKFNRADPKETENEERFGDLRHREGESRADERRTEKSSSQNAPLENLQGELSTSQIVYLLGLLDKADDILLEKILITLSSSCAFTSNQNLVRENGGIDNIMRLVDHEKNHVRLRVLQTLSNLSMNLENQKLIKQLMVFTAAMTEELNKRIDCIPNILAKISPEQVESTNEDELIAILQLLVNLTVVDTCHADLVDGISYCLHILEQDSLSDKAKTNALRVLVNFSCNADNADFFFQEKRLDAFVNFLAEPVTEDNTLRAVTIIANIVKFECDKKEGTPKVTTRGMPEKLMVKLLFLENSENEEIREKVLMINNALKN